MVSNMTGTEIIMLLTQNVDSICSVVGPIAGAIFTAVFLRNNTATKEFEKVKAGKLEEVAEDLLKSGKMTYTEFYKANNFLKIAKKADEEYVKLPMHPYKKVAYDFDWFMMFYETVGNISNDKMQQVWAKILAGEINKPGTFSLRIIDVLKCISQEEAETFSKLCEHCVCVNTHLFLPNYEKYLKKCNINYSEIMLLDEMGLINSDGMVVLNVQLDSSPKALFINRMQVMCISSKEGTPKNLSIRQFPLTKVGDELAAALGNSLSDDDFILFAKEVDADSKVNVEVHRISNIMNEQITYDDFDLLHGTSSETGR